MTNYAGWGPDLAARINYEARQLAESTNKCLETAKELVAARLHGGKKMFLVTEVHLDNPVILNFQDSSPVNFNDIADVANKAVQTIGLPSLCATKVKKCLYDTAACVLKYRELGTHAQDLRDCLATLPYHLPTMPGVFAYAELFRELLINIGYDGVVYPNAERYFIGMQLRPNTRHVVAFHTEKVDIIYKTELDT